MQIEQTFEVAADQNRVWALMRDPAQMITCIPGCESIEATGPDQYQAVIAVAVGPIKARFSLAVNIVEESPPSHVKTQMRGDEGGRASLIQSVNDVRLAPVDDNHTRVTYVSTVDISGRLGRYGSGMMQKLANRLGTQFQTAFCALAEATAATDADESGKSNG
ncbi:MAG: carbon monoxide dehydrogenase subunit G [Burkholderiaceae bacterium]